MSVKRLILLLALALMVVSVSAQDATTVKIFTSWPLTGGTQAVGGSMLKAVELALEHYMADHEGMGPGGSRSNPSHSTMPARPPVHGTA
ncbi:MAG: hypothetical protein IPK52_16380 [Chloroflexi bacterium]|nr:hypothetical protein [Chloroflexota bacterium]